MEKGNMRWEKCVNKSMGLGIVIHHQNATSVANNSINKLPFISLLKSG